MTCLKSDTWCKATCNWSELCVEMGCGRVRLPGGLLHTYDVGVTGTFYNYVLVQDPNSFSLRMTEAEFSRRGLPFAIRIPRENSFSEFERSLCDARYALVPVWKLMTHEKDAGERNRAVTVERVGSDRLADWIAIISTGFNLSEKHRVTQYEMVRRASRSESVQLLLAILNEKPVGTGLLYFKDRIASIHMISTLPEFRKKHVATTIILEARDRCKDEKANMIWLRTRKGGIGEKVYSKIGFKPFSDILTYTRTPNLDSTAFASNRSQQSGHSI